MNYLLASFALGIVFISFTANVDAVDKYTEIKEYSAKYELTGNSSGTKDFSSQQWGNKQCWIEKSTMDIMGNKQTKNEKVIAEIKDGEQWITTINLDDNTGKEMKNPMFSGIAQSIKGKSPKEFSKSYMQQLGGKEGEKMNINGEDCTKWTLMGGAFTCITEDLIAVESGADMAGIQIKETAVEVKRNDSGPAGLCDVGDAKIEQINLDQFLGQ